jgi:hypothetical protein
VRCGLVAALLAALLYGLGLAANNARAGTEQSAEPAQVAAAPETPVEIAPPKTPEQVIADQTAGASSSATQEQPTNVVVSIRVNSPGDNGPISQTNLVISDAGSSNAASTTQDGAPEGGSGQDVATQQQAGADTTVTQDGAGNLVVVVRINSPGDNGPISQTNATVATSGAQNTSETTQGEPAAPSAASAGPKEKAAGAPPRTSRRRPHRAAAPRRQGAVATAPAPTPPTQPVFATHGSDTKAQARPQHQPRHPANARNAQHERAAANDAGFGGRTTANPLGTAVAKAGDLLGTVAPRAPLDGTRSSADVTNSVLFSLLAVFVLAAVFVGWSLLPERLRVKRLPKGLLR